MHRFALELAYKGTSFSGWQIQPNAESIQSILEEKLSLLYHLPVKLVGCGRTDSGVHAGYFIAHFDLPSTNPIPLNIRSLNALLPIDISVNNCWIVPPDFHARFDAIYRKYIYRLHLNKDPLALVNSTWMRNISKLSEKSLNEAAEIIQGLHDFRAFVKSGHQLNSFECKIYESRWEETKAGNWEYHIAANRFLRGMVRLIVGMTIQYAQGKLSLAQIRADLETGVQLSQSLSVPAQGLTLEMVKYPEALWLQKQALNFGV